MCLWDQGIDNDGGGVARLRRARRLSDDNRGIGRGQGIRNVSKVLETPTESAGDIYKWKRWRRNMRKKTKTTTTDVSAEDRRRFQGVEDNGGGVSVSMTGLVGWKRQHTVGFLAFRFLIVTLSCLCLVAVSF